MTVKLILEKGERNGENRKSMTFPAKKLSLPFKFYFNYVQYKYTYRVKEKLFLEMTFLL